ncbi:hypothetical protein OUZ56_011147 [Daphnia magna]|uniref:Uncharacterized protein n=1 Tax=Daphnia magna TaxID=35525 RepID=A0ABQ9YZE3_9CRUS|nr:hypothetical protein OUZ56_011147 [Daphnia magna]
MLLLLLKVDCQCKTVRSPCKFVSDHGYPHRHQAYRLRLAVLASRSSLCRLRLAAFASPSLPYRLHFAVFASWSSPRHLQADRLRLTVIEVIVFAASPLIAPVFALSPSSWSLVDRRRCSTPWLIDHGVGQSPCALGRRRQCTSRDFSLSMRWWSTWGVHSRKGLHCQVSPDLSSDKSPFHRIPQKRCVATVVEQSTGCNGLAANGIPIRKFRISSTQDPHKNAETRSILRISSDSAEMFSGEENN